MNVIELLAEGLEGNGKMLKNTLADFTDAEMLIRPAPAANHAMWQLGHLINAETNMVNAVRPGTMPELPAGFADRFNGKTTGVDDPAQLSTKADLLALMDRTRAATVKWVRSLNEKDLEQPTPEKLQRFAPTVAQLLLKMPVHTALHTGQMQAIRRKLGKPVLF